MGTITIVEIKAINGCTLAIYYCSDDVYRLSIIDLNGRTLEFNDVFFSSQAAANEARLILRILTR